MHTSISHYNTISQAPGSYYHTIALKSGIDKIGGMRKADLISQIANRQRAAIKAVMSKHDLKVTPWCRSAGISEGTLRNFLSGENDALGSTNIERLAITAGISIAEIFGEEVHYKIDDDLMLKCTKCILTTAKNKGRKLSRVQEMAYTVLLYNHINEYRKKGENIEPSLSLAALILQQQVA